MFVHCALGRGCINDVRNIRTFVKSHYGFSDENILQLTDDQQVFSALGDAFSCGEELSSVLLSQDPRLMPSRQNITFALEWLVTGKLSSLCACIHAPSCVFSGGAGLNGRVLCCIVCWVAIRSAAGRLAFLPLQRAWGQREGRGRRRKRWYGRDHLPGK